MKKYLLTLFCFCFSINLFAQNENEIKICNQAQEYYQMGRLDDAVTFLESNIKSLSTLPKVTALRVLALCYLEKDQMELAEKCVSQLLKEDPYYNISLNDPPRFVDMVAQLKRGESAVITTASQQAESLSEVPVPVTLITEEMIKESGARTLSDLLTLYVPGMSFIEGLEMNMAMHGVYSTLQEKILVMQDGHRLNSRANNSEAFDFRTSLDKVKQIEVLRGPASSLYGNVALTAVVNIITKKGNDLDGIYCSLGFGNNHTYQPSITFGKRTMGIDVLGWASVYASEGEKRNISVTDREFYGSILQPGKMYINGFNHQPAYDFGFSLNWQNFKFMFSMQDAKRVNPYIPFLKAGIYDYDKYRKYDGKKPGHSRKTTRFDVSYNKQVNDKFSYKFTGFLDLEDCSNYDVVGDSLAPADRWVPIRPGEVISPDLGLDIYDKGIYQVQTWNDYTYGFAAQANYIFNLGKWNNSLLTGIQMENYTMQDNKMVLGDRFERIVVTYSVNNRTIEFGDELNISPFVQLKTKFSEKFIFNGGLRFDSKHRYDGKWLKVLSPRLSFIYNASSAANFKLSYSRAFVDAPFFYRANRSNTYQGGKDLNPEYNNAVQLTFEGNTKNNSFKYQSNIFYNKLKDLTYRDIKEFKYTNAGSLDMIGFEQVFSGNFGKSNAYLNFTYQRVIDATNYTASNIYVHHVPAFMMNGMYNYQLFNHSRYGRLSANLVINVLSKQKAPLVSTLLFKGPEMQSDINNEVPARAILNMGVDYNLKSLFLSVKAYNLLNKDYYQGGDFPMPIPQQGFNFMTKIGYKF